METNSSALPRQRSLKTMDDVTSLTSFNPFSEEDEHDQSSYALVTSLFSKVKNTLTAPLISSATNTITSPTVNSATAKESLFPVNPSSRPQPERPGSLSILPSILAPPVVSITRVVSEASSYYNEHDRPPSRGGLFSSPIEPHDPTFGTAIPGFPIADDARSIRTNGSANLKRTASVSKVIRRIRGEGLSRDYWMDDANAKECYDCKSVFTTWRRKHHCRICGQIFCSRCASNIIKGSRFGQDGMIRVCNLCLEKLEKGGADDDDDDRRSVLSSTTSFAALPHSPFAASQIFYRTDEPYSLFSIAETRRQVSDDGSTSPRSRPLTPGNEWETPAPFRRNPAADDEHERADKDVHSDSALDTLPAPLEPQNLIQFPTAATTTTDGGVGKSTIQFPGSTSCDSQFSAETPRPTSLRTSRVNSFAETEIAVPFLRSRVHSRLEWSGGPEAGWRTRRESTAYAQELNAISMFHLRVMLRQMLTKEGVPNLKEWEETLLKLALPIARDLTFTAMTTSMDVRQHVKIKKIPGGAPRDSEYVDGAVITKNVAHKQMARGIRHPRVMLVTFPFEFHRVEGQYMHLDPLVNQEKQYLTNLVARVAALRPHVVLVEKSVSRIALEALVEHNIAVARTVKSSAIQFVARMTQADVFSSMDKLAVEPRLGHCLHYRLQTFDHALIPGRRKTYMRFEGCSREMGCTIILRGGSIETLRRIKNVTRFLAFVVRHLKMETHLWKDSVITLPPVTAYAVPVPPPAAAPVRPRTFSAPTLSFLAGVGASGSAVDESQESAVEDEEDDELPLEDVEQVKLSRRIQQSVESYHKTFISISATLRFPPPYPIRRMKELDDLLRELRCAWEDEVVLRGERSPSLSSPLITQPQQPQHDRDATVKAAQVSPSLSSPDVSKTPMLSGSTMPLKPEESFTSITSYFDRPVSSSTETDLESMRDSIASLVVPSIDGSEADAEADDDGAAAMGTSSGELERPVVLRQVADIAKESALSLAQLQFDEHLPVWEWYLRKNSDDFVIDHYQTLYVREFITPIAQLEECKPCFYAHITYFTFYGANDCTLGQYIENAVTDGIITSPSQDPKAPCTGCEQPIPAHCKVFVHNESRLFIALEPWSGKIQAKTADAPVHDLVTTWSVCRRCTQATPFIPVSEETLRYSFAKFLELHFYPADVLIVPGAGCSHNIYLDHARYFAYKGMVLRFQAEPVVIQEVVFPPRRIRVRPETLLELKNSYYSRMLDRSASWFNALIRDLRLLLVELGDSDLEASAKAAAFIREAETHRQQMARDIHRIYDESPPTDTLALGRARQLLQEHKYDWQSKLDTLPRPKLSQATEKEPKRTATFGSVRHIWPVRSGSSSTLDKTPSASVSEIEEEYLRRFGTPTSFAHSSASENESLAPPSVEPASQIAEKKSPDASDEASPPPQASPQSPAITNLQKSDPDSDSTIGARRRLSQVSMFSSNIPQPSKLPRRAGTQISVAELVKKYDPAMEAPESSPSMTGKARDTNVPRIRKTKSKKTSGKQPLYSDFEQSYAANIAPKYLTHSARRQPPNSGYTSRIPAPVSVAPIPVEPKPAPTSRQASPEKRQRVAGPPSRVPTSSLPDGNLKTNKGKGTPRVTSRDKTRPTPNFSKGTFRRTVSSTGSKVSSMARHFDRLAKDNSEKANRRYAVIRGRRARPVASARPSVQVFESIQDVMGNDSGGDDESSDADDEEDGEEDEPAVILEPPVASNEDVKVDVATDVTPAPVEPTAAPAEDQPLASSSTSPSPSSPTSAKLIPAVRRRSSTPPISSSLSHSPLPSVPPSPGLPPSLFQSPDGWGHTSLERHSFMKAISGLWSQRSQLNFPKSVTDSLEDLLIDHVHIHRDSPIALRTDEPTSIIAVALSCKDYRERQKAVKLARRKTRESAELFMPDDRSTAESTSSWGVVDLDNIEEEGDAVQFLKQYSNSEHVWSFVFPFDDVTITCVAMFPEQFHAMRRIFECEKSIIESLARCVKWNTAGGKSGSGFLKTRDDRFIAKELSKAELSAMATFAPAYFEYMASTTSDGRPTLLAKIFGCFRISFAKPQDPKKGVKGKTSSTVFLVMENLFYDGSITSNIYDLKGSTRNRHVHVTGRENEVLLDENLVKMSHLNPLYLREHSKRILRAALWSDSKFLADLNVMDYSLVVGVDSVKNELVMGIVDYIRTYTWDKKLESWVKDTSFLGGGSGKGEPTIVTPKQYKARFRTAMERYFPLVPDRWMKQKDQPNEEGDNLLDVWNDG
ncbi:hypothetical protein BU17DRAFT_50059 [Hysterangium stoloniferum]|nr:hypothetical protein BU17DRAFT_50059 [Hysterangium stoloniferum]